MIDQSWHPRLLTGQNPSNLATPWPNLTWIALNPIRVAINSGEAFRLRDFGRLAPLWRNRPDLSVVGLIMPLSLGVARSPKQRHWASRSLFESASTSIPAPWFSFRDLRYLPKFTSIFVNFIFGSWKGEPVNFPSRRRITKNVVFSRNHQEYPKSLPFADVDKPRVTNNAILFVFLTESNR